MVSGFFISATDTNIGKTVVCAILGEKLGANYYKPIQCGLDDKRLTDCDKVRQLSLCINILKKHIFKEPVGPYVASKNEKKIDLNKIFEIKKLEMDKKLLVEGAGGLYVPIKRNYFMSDLCKDFGLPLILVTKTDLGTINHTLMSLEIIKQKRINLTWTYFYWRSTKKDTINYIKTAGGNIIKQKIKILGRLPFLKITPQHIKEFGKKVKL